MNKLKAFLLLGLICVILAGCSNVFAKKDYYDTNKIAAVEDRYAKKNSASNSNDSGYSLNVEEFNGRETVWTLFGLILIYNLWLLIKKVTPVYSVAFNKN